MTENRARRILGESVRDDGSLGDPYMHFYGWDLGQEEITIEGGSYSPDELEAIAWMRNIKKGMEP